MEQRKLEMVEEFESHIELAVADRVARGESPEEARRRAMAEFGNMPLVADVTRERWGWLRLERLTQDLKYALRTLKRDRGFTAISILILALGVGANVVVFRRGAYDPPAALAVLAAGEVGLDCAARCRT